jgi:hypothetical protein
MAVSLLICSGCTAAPRDPISSAESTGGVMLPKTL